MFELIKKYYFLLLVIILSFLLILECIFIYNGNSIDEDSIATINKVDVKVENKEDDNQQFLVEIKGRVQTPGVYLVSSVDTIDDVLEKSGGLLNDAYTDNINLSQKVVKQMFIYIYSVKESKNLPKDNYNICYVKTYDISKCLRNGYSLIVTDKNQNESLIENNQNNPSKDNSQNVIVNINTADINMLTTLPGIGQAKAQKIIAYREEFGNFKKIEDIKKVSGIGDATYEQIKKYLTI